jgi:hypothetical protein
MKKAIMDISFFLTIRRSYFSKWSKKTASAPPGESASHVKL